MLSISVSSISTAVNEIKQEQICVISYTKTEPASDGDQAIEDALDQLLRPVSLAWRPLA